MKSINIKKQVKKFGYKNPQRKIEYDRANAAMKKQASEDFLSNPLFEITPSSQTN